MTERHRATIHVPGRPASFATVCHLAQDIEVAVVARGLLDEVQEYKAQGHRLPVAHRLLRAAVQVQTSDELAAADRCFARPTLPACRPCHPAIFSYYTRAVA